MVLLKKCPTGFMLSCSVGKVDAFAMEGCALWFNSNDHLPPHFHVEKSGAWELRVFFLRDGDDMFDLAWGKSGPSGKLKKQIEKRVDAHRDALLEEWEAKTEVTAPGSER